MGRLAPAFGRHSACKVFEKAAPAAGSVWLGESNFFQLPHERLHAYQQARKLLECIREAEISGAKLRDQALRAGTSVCLNIAEAVGRTGFADRARVFAIARGECCEAGAALDIALAAGRCRTDAAGAGAAHARAAYALLTGLIRRFG
ncbi:MAG TPA: four helix bundle protein [Myxococcales bacterium]